MMKKMILVLACLLMVGCSNNQKEVDVKEKKEPTHQNEETTQKQTTQQTVKEETKEEVKKEIKEETKKEEVKTETKSVSKSQSTTNTSKSNETQPTQNEKPISNNTIEVPIDPDSYYELNDGGYSYMGSIEMPKEWADDYYSE